MDKNWKKELRIKERLKSREERKITILIIWLENTRQ